MSEVAFLRRVPVLAGLSEAMLERLAAGAETVQIRAGEWLFREGEAATSLYVVRSGRFEVVAEGSPEVLIRVVRRGEVLGELALLHEGVRTASVRARRDGTLLAVGRAQFDALIREETSFAVALIRSMGAQLAANRSPPSVAQPPRTVAVIALEAAAPAREAAALLAAALATHGTVAELRPEAGRAKAEMTAMLDRAERGEDRVLLVGGANRPGDEWTDFCVREAELVVAVTAGDPVAQWSAQPEALRGCELLVVAPVVDDALIEAFQPRHVQVVTHRGDLGARMEALGRRLSGTSLGLALSGGGARALAHLGVLEELQAAGLKVDRIGAVSMGAVIGALVASGLEIEDTVEVLRVNRNPAGDYALPLFSLVRGKRSREFLQDHFGDQRIEALPSSFFCVSCDLIARETVHHRTGSLYDGVRASLCLPGVFPPIATPTGRLLVDGGVLDNLPVESMARTGEGPVIAVDVSAQGGADFRYRGRPGVGRLARPLRQFLTGSEAAIPRLGETIVRTLTVGSIDTVEAAKRHADLVIQPQVDDVGMFDRQGLERARAAGRAATRAALASAPAGALG